MKFEETLDIPDAMTRMRLWAMYSTAKVFGSWKPGDTGYRLDVTENGEIIGVNDRYGDRFVVGSWSSHDNLMIDIVIDHDLPKKGQ